MPVSASGPTTRLQPDVPSALDKAQIRISRGQSRFRHCRRMRNLRSANRSENSTQSCHASRRPRFPESLLSRRHRPTCGHGRRQRCPDTFADAVVVGPAWRSRTLIFGTCGDAGHAPARTTYAYASFKRWPVARCLKTLHDTIAAAALTHDAGCHGRSDQNTRISPTTGT